MEYKIHGSVMPLLELALSGNETIIAQPGAMKWMSQNVEMNTNMHGGLLKSLKRTISGENLFLTKFSSDGNGNIAFGHSYPGVILPIDVSHGKSLVCQKRAFLCASSTVDLDVYFQRRLGTGIFGGEGFIMQKIPGPRIKE